MPYIEQEARPPIDRAVNELIAGLDLSKLGLGEFNYLLTRLVMCYLHAGPRISYERLSAVKGMLTDIRDEFNRRLLTPYEDSKKAENGEVYK